MEQETVAVRSLLHTHLIPDVARLVAVYASAVVELLQLLDCDDEIIKGDVHSLNFHWAGEACCLSAGRAAMGANVIVDLQPREAFGSLHDIFRCWHMLSSAQHLRSPPWDRFMHWVRGHRRPRLCFMRMMHQPPVDLTWLTLYQFVKFAGEGARIVGAPDENGVPVYEWYHKS